MSVGPTVGSMADVQVDDHGRPEPPMAEGEAATVARLSWTSSGPTLRVEVPRARRRPAPATGSHRRRTRLGGLVCATCALRRGLRWSPRSWPGAAGRRSRGPNRSRGSGPRALRLGLAGGGGLQWGRRAGGRSGRRGWRHSPGRRRRTDWRAEGAAALDRTHSAWGRSGLPRPCAGCWCTWSRSTRGTTGTRTCCARPSTARPATVTAALVMPRGSSHGGQQRP